MASIIDFLEDSIRILSVLALAALNQKLIELIFIEGYLTSLIGILGSSLFFPVFFVLAERRREIKEYLEPEELTRRELKELLGNVIQFWPSFLLVASISWLIKTKSILDSLFNSPKLETGLIGLNYALILVISVYYFRRNFGEEKLGRILNK